MRPTFLRPRTGCWCWNESSVESVHVSRPRHPETRAEFTERWAVVSPDWSQDCAFSPDTFRATPCLPPPWASGMDNRSKEPVEGSLCSGALLSPTEWFGALTAAQAQGDFEPGVPLPSELRASTKEAARLLVRARTDPAPPRPRIETMERVADTEYRAAGFVRDPADGLALRLADPDSLLLLHRPGRDGRGPLTLTRVTPAGDAVWRRDGHRPVVAGPAGREAPGAEWRACAGDEEGLRAGPGAGGHRQQRQDGHGFLVALRPWCHKAGSFMGRAVSRRTTAAALSLTTSIWRMG